MSNLELIEALCGLLGTAAHIIEEQRKTLLQLDALVAEDEIAEARAKYNAILGAGERTDAEPENGGGNNGTA